MVKPKCLKNVSFDPAAMAAIEERARFIGITSTAYIRAASAYCLDNREFEMRTMTALHEANSDDDHRSAELAKQYKG